MFGVSQAREVLSTIRATMVEKRDFLIELDSVIGDGDLGLTMAKAFTAADEQSASFEDDDIGKFFSQAGMAMAKAAPSTMGTLVGTGFMRGGKALKGKTQIEPTDIAAFFRAFADGLMERGKTAPGEKTIVDVFDPVATACASAVAHGADFGALAKRAREAAYQGREEAKGMMSQHGKAAIYREQTKGKEDPGANAGVFVVEGFVAVMEGV